MRVSTYRQQQRERQIGAPFVVCLSEIIVFSTFFYFFRIANPLVKLWRIANPPQQGQVKSLMNDFRKHIMENFRLTDNNDSIVWETNRDEFLRSVHIH